MDKRFGDILRRYRSEAGVSLGKLAAHLGVTVVYLSNVELGKSAPLTLDRIRQASELIGHYRELLLASAADRGTIEVKSPETDFGQMAMATLMMRYTPTMSDEDLKKLFKDLGEGK